MSRLALMRGWLAMGAAAVGMLAAWGQADDAPRAAVGPDPLVYERLVRRASEFLRTQQDPEGAYSKSTGIGVTALCGAALLQSGRSPEDPAVARTLKFLEGFRQADGGIYTPGTGYKNYETSLAMMCFSQANQGGKYTPLLKSAEAFLKKIQWDEDEEQKPEDLAYGGAGYGKNKRPDLSNTAFMLEALKAVGTGPDDPAVQRALIFVTRSQNFENAANTAPFAAKNPDGGFYYTPAAGGSSQAGTTDNGGLRSYASMTYAGLKSMIYAGVKADDPRVKAATTWLKKNYSLKTNPGMGEAGLFYYYHTFAKALDALGSDTFVDADGKVHDWRAELVAELASRQREDGSFVNPNDRWYEGDPALVTGYALLALTYCKPRPAAR